MQLDRSCGVVVVDVQNDFLPGGALAVPEGDQVIAPLNAAIERVRRAGGAIVATRDWHPANHCSFQAQGGPWPVHCVQNTKGAAFAEALKLPEDALIVSKAMRPDQEAYSGFEGEPDLAAWLKRRGIQRLFVGGLATDYCVRATVLDALRHGFAVVVLTDAVRGVDPKGAQRALSEMQSKGAQLATTAALA